MSKKNNKSIITLVVVALVVVGGIFVSNLCTDKPIVPVSKQEKVLEPVAGRIDVFAAPYTEEARFVVYEADQEKPLNEAAWMPKNGYRGYALQKNGNSRELVIKVIENADIKLVLRGPDKRDENGKFIEQWVDFTSLTINGEEVLPGKTPVWHNKPFTHMIKARAGDIYIVSAKWQQPED